MRALIVEDEPIARSRLRRLLDEISWLECVGEVGDGWAAVDAIDRKRPDVVFLDIQLPGRTGMDVLREIRHRPAVIFTTAFDHYAVAAFELQAVDYLLKPFGRRRLHAALDRLRHATPSHPATPVDELATATERAPLDHLYVRDRGKVTPLRVETVERLESCGDYVGAWVAGRRHLIHVALRDVETRLDGERFVRIHRSHIINLEHVRDVRPHAGARLRVTMRDGVSLIASRARTPALRRRLR